MTMVDGFLGRLDRVRRSGVDPRAEAVTTARFGGDDDREPVLVGVVAGPIPIEMAREALADAGIPALVQRSSLAPVYGLAIGSFGRAAIWAPAPLAEEAYAVLVDLGLLEPDGVGGDS